MRSSIFLVLAPSLFQSISGLGLQNTGSSGSKNFPQQRKAASYHSKFNDATTTTPWISPATSTVARLTVSAVVISSLVCGGPTNADEYGVEVEAPTLFTGETVMICKRRGPLGACLETVQRTEENDNDKAKKYFRDPTELIKEKEAAMRGSDNMEGNALIQRLRAQTQENKEKNDLSVQAKTFENDQSATFGPFDRQVLIMNTDGRTFTLLANPQAMRLKKAGFIEDRRFIKQPTEGEIEAALTGEETGFVGAMQGIFGGGSND